ncbi:MAG TPA: D-alanyl-lipoteichoic acid biosynthesis protein DltD [Symbiobacteriaceae bacterium]|jgi:D-alanine transfer protein|nr:D-alanyl-lipoteichoic acid biosynthesis protein DltD [Symbiobacteriaceae bacterium]
MAKHSALRAGAIALILCAALILTAQAALGSWTLSYLDRLAPEGEDEVVKGLYLTRSALNRPDYLVALGSSELTFQDQFHAARLFNDKPTGFGLFAVGAGYRQSIHNFLVLSALGKDVAGKRIVLFVSPTWFTKDITDKAYQKNYSALQAYEFVTHAPLSPRLKQRAARRLLQLGSPATDDPLLRNALEAEANPTPAGQIEELAAAPFLRLSLAHQQFKDRWDLARLIVRKDLKPGVRWKHPDGIDWGQLRQKADDAYAPHAGKNVFGMNQDFFAKFVEPKLAQVQNSATAETWLNNSEYDDLQLVLDTLQELKARPLFISLPINGQYDDFKGHAAGDRHAYYAKVRQEIEAAGYPLVDLTGHEYDPGYHNDPWHQGWKGSVDIAQAIDDFYHDRLPHAGR